jgi:MFS family permease
MLRVRTFGLAVGASILFFGGFGAMLLSGVLFLTGVWHEGVLSAGLMLFPGPAMATTFSIPSARLGARFGYRLPGVIGALMFAGGSIWFITQTGNHPAFLSEYLPGSMIGGAGVGLMIPTLTGAGASSLPPERFATGAAVLTMGRQIGAALGIAVLVAVLGAGASTAADFHSSWLITVAGGLAAGLALVAIGPPVKREAGAGESAGASERARPIISEPIADPLIVEPLVLEEELA